MLRYASRHEKHLPANFYNLKADLPELPPPPLNPATREPLNPSDLEAIFPKSFIAQEVSLERELAIPEKVREAYSVFRPTPL
ncbi:MAG TPA: TrpB-like pyridoxal-phosphate dependent enzyme, partial [Candidatus Saccharicenans sp.]|nr:TrpB-like pyridoxal-phosphate dependent enzyme [Candidatus Saccharicenans sp.]